MGKPVPSPDPEFLERARSVIAEAAAKANITVVLGTERLVDGALVATALVINPDGSLEETLTQAISKMLSPFSGEAAGG